MSLSKVDCTVEPKLSVVIGGFSSAGVKDENQDAFAACQPTTSEAKYKGVAVCVADGVSCSEKAQQASATCVTNFIQDYYSTPDSWDVKTAAGKVLSSLNAWLYHHGQQASAQNNSLVSTFSGLILRSATAHVCHVGDSRVYLYRQGEFEQISRDHVHRHFGGREMLSRAMGMDLRVDVDYQEVAVQPGDVFVLSTDGLHGWIDEQALNTAMQKVAAEAFDQFRLEKLATELVAEAMSRGSDDNLTLCFVKVESVAAPDIAEARKELQVRVIPPVLQPGNTIDHYQVEKVLFSGVRSHVYLCRNRRNDELCVLKAPSASFEDDLIYLEAFYREQWIGSRVQHENLMRIYPALEQSRFLYHVSEWLDGISLRQWMFDHPQASLQDMRRIAAGIIGGLRALQRQGVWHRDLKPENVMLLADGSIKLIDYGAVYIKGLADIRPAFDEECPPGSVDYVAPETVVSKSFGMASDQFSLAVILYEMLGGKLPYDMTHVHRRGGRSISEWRYRSLTGLREDIPPWLDLALAKACAPEAGLRYESYSEFQMDLSRPNDHLLERYRQRPLAERNPVLVWQGISLILLIVVILQALMAGGG